MRAFSSVYFVHLFQKGILATWSSSKFDYDFRIFNNFGLRGRIIRLWLSILLRSWMFERFIHRIFPSVEHCRKVICHYCDHLVIRKEHRICGLCIVPLNLNVILLKWMRIMVLAALKYLATSCAVLVNTLTVTHLKCTFCRETVPCSLQLNSVCDFS